jgi:23S rRNA (adenine2503-C2)-methyltransferase
MSEFPSFRLKQAETAIFATLLDDWEKSNLPQEIKKILQKELPLKINFELEESRDKKTQKVLVELEDNNRVEAVLMRHADGRNTACLSSQVGCPLGCVFCATGNLGFKRNLTWDEIILQILLLARILHKDKQKITNVVFMGMGEPLLNWDEVKKAIEVINDKQKFNIGVRKISVSTVGILGGIKKIANYPAQINLAWSLHAPNEHLRQQIIPASKNNPIKSILKELSLYMVKTKRRVMIEYLLINGLNDHPDLARELCALLKNNLSGPYFVNLITCNPSDLFKPSTLPRIEKFQNILTENNVPFVSRFKFGQDINGACGQLAAKYQKLKQNYGSSRSSKKFSSWSPKNKSKSLR